MEWFAILIPIVVVTVLKCIYGYKITWWEMVLPLLPVLLIVPVCKLMGERSVTNDTELHGGWAVEAKFYEAWNEYIHQTCTRTVGTGKDQTTETYDCSYILYHPEYYELVDSNGYTISINRGQFEGLCAKFANRTFHDMHRAYYTQDGDMYSTKWSGNRDSIQDCTTEHTYENRVQASHGVINFPDVDKIDAKLLYKFPEVIDSLNYASVLGTGYNSSEADAYLRRANAELGRRKQVRMWLLLFHDVPRSTGLLQESYWKGGNKNEVVVCVGLKGEGVAWCNVFAWSPDGNTSNDGMKIEIRDFIEGLNKFDALRVAEFMVEEMKTDFVRKSFKEFSYIDVQCPQWAVTLIYVLTILTTGGISYYITTNEIDE